jgi:hypothetical protein
MKDDGSMVTNQESLEEMVVRFYQNFFEVQENLSNQI